MKKKAIYKETSRFRGQILLAILFVFLVLVVVRLADLILATESLQWDLIGLSVGTLLVLAGLIWYYWHLEIRIRITRKGITYSRFPFPGRKEKIRWKDVEDYEFVATPTAAQWHGGNISFNHEERISAVGRNGLLLHTRDGRDILIGSNHLPKLKRVLTQVFGPDNHRENA